MVVIMYRTWLILSEVGAVVKLEGATTDFYATWTSCIRSMVYY